MSGANHSLIGKGSFIDGQFMQPSSTKASSSRFSSADPANDFAKVWEGESGLPFVDDAVAAAQRAQPLWAELSHERRAQHLLKLRNAFRRRAGDIAEALISETGKPEREAKGEAAALGARVDLTLGAGMERIATLDPKGVAGHARAHAQGVLVVLGPYNYPVHLLNAHVIPALATGNAVIVKPSEHCPWAGELYAECVQEAGLPAGVFQLVQGAADVGKALVEHDDIQGVLFTGSYNTGRAIQAACLDAPHKIVALEMGGKNAAVVLDDANLESALSHIVQGAFLSAGQRCTATSRVLLHKDIADVMRDQLVHVTSRLKPKDPRDPTAPFGPLANRPAYDRFRQLRTHANDTADILVAGEDLGGGAFVTPSLHELNGSDGAGYLDEELFGPDICVEVIDNLDHAIERVNALPYGLSNALFTSSQASFEHFFHRTRSGLCNLNRSTNGASGLLPFGGVGKSGNQRPAGIDAVRYTSFPVAVMDGTDAAASVESAFAEAFADRPDVDAGGLSLSRLSARHDVESLMERVRLYVDKVSGSTLWWPRSAFAAGGVSSQGLKLDGVDADVALAERLDTALLTDEHLMLSVTDTDVVLLVEDAVTSMVEQNPRALLSWPQAALNAPKDGKLPRSDAFLQRMYDGEFVPRERKTPVVDLLRSEGTLLRSVDDEPLVIADAASQIASLGLGFSPGAFAAALDDGSLGEAVVSNVQPDGDDERLQSFEKLLVDEAGGHLPYVTYASGGAEANERAFDLCRVNADSDGKAGGRRIIAFEGSFHGRTLASLHATYNPVKRAPFEFKGYEVSFVPFPGWKDPRFEPAIPDGWIASWAAGKAPADVDKHDVLLQAEVASLENVKQQILADGEPACAVIVEPFQGEGGDNFATRRFMNGLRALTRCYGVPLVFDEVQTGFGLCGPFFWHRHFDLHNKDGQPDAPDCVTMAKKSQVGMCLSRWQDTRGGPVHVLQALRGHIHASAILEADVAEVEDVILTELRQLEIRRSDIISAPRGHGYSFAFDLPTKHQAMQFVAQRFYRGFMVYIAGERTVRFRLSAAWTPADIAQLFARIDEALLALLHHGPEWTAPSWMNRADNVGKREPLLDVTSPLSLARLLDLSCGGRERAADWALKDAPRVSDDQLKATAAALGADLLWPSESADAVAHLVDDEVAWAAFCGEHGITPTTYLVHVYAARVLRIEQDTWATYKDGVMAIENATYEDGRRETDDEIRAMLEGEGGVGLLAIRRREGSEHVVGYAFGGPVENYQADGPRTDPRRGQRDTFYSGNITVAPDAKGAGIGMRLKDAQVRQVMQVRDDEGNARYHFMTGRNRVGHTLEMGAINRAYGSYIVDHFKGNQYGDLSGQAVYYRIPLRAPVAQPVVDVSVDSDVLDWRDPVQRPLAPSHERLQSTLKRGTLRAAVGTKLTLSNWVTPDVVRYAELIKQASPKGLKHAYFTSGQAELVDKGLRSLRVHREGAQTVLTFKKQFFGTNSAAARSITDDEGYAQPFGWFDWPQLPHPSEVGDDASLGALMAAIQKQGKDDVLAIVIELVGERSGATLSTEFVDALFAIRKDTGIPVVIAESASALGRSGDGMWASDALSERPNMVWWYTGGQLGHIFVDDAFYVAKPLTLISTWDGDEVCAHRARAALLQAQTTLADGIPQRFAEKVSAVAKDAGVDVTGKGMWQVLHVGDKANDIVDKLKAKGLHVQAGAPGTVRLTPPLDVTVDDIDRAMSIVKDAMR